MVEIAVKGKFLYIVVIVMRDTCMVTALRAQRKVTKIASMVSQQRLFPG